MRDRSSDGRRALYGAGIAGSLALGIVGLVVGEAGLVALAVVLTVTALARSLSGLWVGSRRVVWPTWLLLPRWARTEEITTVEVARPARVGTVLVWADGRAHGVVCSPGWASRDEAHRVADRLVTALRERGSTAGLYDRVEARWLIVPEDARAVSGVRSAGPAQGPGGAGGRRTAWMRLRLIDDDLALQLHPSVWGRDTRLAVLVMSGFGVVLGSLTSMVLPSVGVLLIAGSAYLGLRVWWLSRPQD